MHRKKVFATALVGLVAISAADIWVSHQVRQERNTLLDTVSSARHETAKLYDELGFGGLIHSFKNYVIRGDEAYRDRVRTTAHSIHIRLERLDAHGRALGLDPDLSAVRDTVSAYEDRLDTVRLGWADSLPVSDIDALVRVDDAPALEQLAAIEAGFESVTRQRMARLNRLSGFQSVLTPTLQALMLGFIIFIWMRMYKTRIQAGREARAQIRNLNASLRAQTLTLERMRESHAALENFTSMVAHDLKAPLRQASMLLHLAKRSETEADRDAHCDKVRESIERANTIVEGFLNLAQLDDQPPETSLGDIGEIFRQAVDELALLHRKAPRHIRIDPLGEAYCDRDLIRQVAINLLTNALKYARPEKTLDIRVRAVRGDTMLTVYVEDNGVGIPQELAERIFSPHVRGESPEPSGADGRGLGLALCRTIIAAHGGDIRMAPGRSTGASIRFTLPLAQPAANTL